MSAGDAPSVLPIVGRYQLIPARVTVHSTAGVSVTDETIFRIDTMTGKTWSYSNLLIGDQQIEGWTPVAEAVKIDRKQLEEAIKQGQGATSPPTIPDATH